MAQGVEVAVAQIRPLRSAAEKLVYGNSASANGKVLLRIVLALGDIIGVSTTRFRMADRAIKNFLP